MVNVSLSELVGRLNDTCRQSLEAAVGLCMTRSNYNVELEHWLFKLIDVNNSDCSAIFRQYNVDTSKLAADILKVIDKLKTGNSRDVALSPDVVNIVSDAWLLASIEFGNRRIRSGHLLLALLESGNEFGARDPGKISAELKKINSASLRVELPALCSKTDEATQAVESSAGDDSGDAPVRSAGPTKTPALDQFTINLTEQAKNGKIDPVIGRDPEIRQIIDILMRRRQNNPILTGEAGVGKTAVVEGFAARIAAGDVPESLRDVCVRTLDLALLQAGAGVKGEFENRLKSVISEVRSSPQPIILFIDEAHTLIGAGGQAGQGDAANLLKPALARGELRTIAATTWAEYKKFFEKDAALTRRFQVVKVEEPDEQNAIRILRGLVPTLEKHHRVRILEEAITEGVRLSKRYISGRQLPDKAVSVLDTTCARICISQSTCPPALEDAQRRIEHLKVNQEILQREKEAGADNAEAMDEVGSQLDKANAELEALTTRWQQEKELVDKILELRDKLYGKPVEKKEAPAAESPAETSAAPAPTNGTADKEEELTPEQKAALREELKQLEGELSKLQGDEPLVHVCVDAQAIAATISAWTGVPLGRMVADEFKTILRLKEQMEESIVGQGHALEAIAQRVRTSRANLADPRTPIGVFLLAGTSGVGKTETAITLANLLYGGEQNMTVINMSEFKEEHKVSLLMGSPPGYVGYGEGGVLTEAVRRKPYSVLLLDEMEKAHPGVQDVFYQVFDKGHMKDGEGRDIDFKNTIILMTTNAGTDLIKSLFSDPDTAPDAEGLAQALFPELLKTFKPAFLGRLTVVPYFPLSDDVLKMIVKLKLDKIRRRVKDHYKAQVEYADNLIENVAKRCTEVDTGARNVDHILNGTLLPQMSTQFLGRLAEGGTISKVVISLTDSDGFGFEIT